MIYFVQQDYDGPIKIGMTGNVRRRISALQTANSGLLRLLGTIVGHRAEEKYIHQHLRFYSAGGEWFRPSIFVLEYIKSLPGYTPNLLAIPEENTAKHIKRPFPPATNLEIAASDCLLQVLKNNHFNKTKTAEELKISRSTLYAKIKKYGIKTPAFVQNPVTTQEWAK